MKTLRLFLIVALIAMAPTLVKANALTVSNLTVTQGAAVGGTVSFTLQWSNSWRVTTVPFNWDAAWVFVKFRQCGAAPTTDWTHGLINTSTATHTYPAAIEPIFSDGSGVGIDAAPNNTGIMFRQAVANVYATAGPYNITLNVTNLPANTTSIDLKVFGIEMVFVPTGSYTLGDGGCISGTWYEFMQTTVDNAVETSAYTFKECNGNNFPVTNAAFPKGYKAFHCMKYEISEGQYAEFLNTLTSAGQSAHYNSPTCTNYRYAITNTGAAPSIYGTVVPDRACNYMRTNDHAAYLDWAALRPMTELEYEKACRGQAAPISGEYAWGNATIPAYATQISFTTPTENGTEVIQTPNACIAWNNPGLSGGYGGQGPLRVGIFALPTTNTRTASGATYYGIMEMSGNVYEMCIPLCTITATTFTSAWGDGQLDASGNANTAGWPVYNNVNDNIAYGFRGGSFANTDVNTPRVSYRDGTRWTRNWTNTCNDQMAWSGGRGVR